MIVPLGREHVGAVAQLHRTILTGLLSDLGEGAARAFYAGALTSGLATGFVFLEGGGVRGFVFGSAHPDRLKKEVLRQNPFGTLAGLLLGVLRRPTALASLLKSFRGPDEGSYDPQAAELTYLAVAAGCRGRGIGRRLVAAFTREVSDGGVAAYDVSVDDDNREAAAFYESVGFRLIGRYREFGVLHRRYRREVLA